MVLATLLESLSRSRAFSDSLVCYPSRNGGGTDVFSLNCKVVDTFRMSMDVIDLYFDRINRGLKELLAWIPQSFVAITVILGLEPLEETTA